MWCHLVYGASMVNVRMRATHAIRDIILYLLTLVKVRMLALLEEHRIIFNKHTDERIVFVLKTHEVFSICSSTME